MPHPRHQLDLIWLPTDPDRPLPEGAASLQDLGWADERGLAGPDAGQLVEGGYAAIRIETRPRVDIWANQQGGYRVRCPDTGDNLVPAFLQALSTYRGGGERSLACPSCGATHPLESLDFAPDAGFSSWALVLRDVQAGRPVEGAVARISAVLGPVRWLVRRSG